jgi:ABC-2 type transport system ATP-binding protein
LPGLTKALQARKAQVQASGDKSLTVSGLTSDQVGEAAFQAGVTVYELTPQRASLEEVFMDLTADSVEYGTTMPGAMPRE